jgi:hypothetical protein
MSCCTDASSHRRHSGTPLAAGPESIPRSGGYGFRVPSLRSGPGNDFPTISRGKDGKKGQSSVRPPSSVLCRLKLAGARRGAPSPHISRPVSRVLCGAGLRTPARDGHSSGTPVARRLEQPTRTAGSGHRSRAPAASAAARPRRPYSVLLPVGFAVPPALPPARCALTAPFHPCRSVPRRFVFCGTFPGVTPAGRYPAPHVHGARTFLPVAGGAVRPTDA